MTLSPHEMLEICTVKLPSGSQYWGTGFFVTKDKIITFVHVVESYKERDSISVLWRGREYEAILERILPLPIDLALLRVKDTDKQLSNCCVLLDTTYNPFDEMFIYGYPDDFPDGGTVTLTCEGSAKDQGVPLIKAKLGQVRPGLSGSPALNFETKKVCGILSETRGRSTDLGGLLIPVKTVFENFPELQVQNSQAYELLEENCFLESQTTNLERSPYHQLSTVIDFSEAVVEGFERKQVPLTQKIEVLDEDIFIGALEADPSSDAYSRYIFARNLGKILSFFHQLSFGCVYTAWRIGRRVFLSTLPEVSVADLIGVPQKTYEFEFSETPPMLSLVAIWEAKEKEWCSIPNTEFYKVVDEQMADRSGCYMLRESILLVLQSRNVLFRFPVVPPEGRVEKFCEWVPWKGGYSKMRQEVLQSMGLSLSRLAATKKDSVYSEIDWDRDPLLASPGLGVWASLFYGQTRTGILLFGVQGSWTKKSLGVHLSFARLILRIGH